MARKFITATLAMIPGQRAAVLESHDQHGNWLGSSRIDSPLRSWSLAPEAPSGPEQDRAAIYEVAYASASHNASVHGGEISRRSGGSDVGVASYNRGSRVISRQFCEAAGCRGCVRCSEPRKPTPRPPGWGGATRARAEKYASGLLAYLRERGQTDPSVEDLAALTADGARVGKATARLAAELALKSP